VDLPSRLEQKAGIKTENLQRASWGEGSASCSEMEVTEQKRREPRTDLEMSCPYQTSQGEDVLRVVEQPIPTPQAQIDAEAGSSQAEGMHF